MKIAARYLRPGDVLTAQQMMGKRITQPQRVTKVDHRELCLDIYRPPTKVESVLYALTRRYRGCRHR